MKFVRLGIFLIILLSEIAHAEFEYIEIISDSSTPITKQCPNNTEVLKLSSGKLSITSKDGKTYALTLDELPDRTELILGHSSPSSNCALAVPYAENDVNRSYSLFVHSHKNKKFVPSQINTVTNPDFSNGRILSSYRDGALLHNDTLCFSERLSDYFACEKREQFHDTLEKMEECDERSCSNPKLVKVGSWQPVIGVIAVERTSLFDRIGEEDFLQRKGYLIKGDKVSLHDYFQARDALYYKITYLGKKIVTGWIRAETISIDG